MAKILIQPKHRAFWFERLSVVSYYSEGQFEQRILNHSSYLFKDYWVIPFKKALNHVSDARKITKPDLVFIKKDYASWILVEVELNGHEYPHVSAQVDVMLHADFNSVEMLTYINSKKTFVFGNQLFSFDQDKLKDLIDKVKPEVMVIVDETKISWESDLNQNNVKLCVIQVYKNGENEEIFRLKGQYPQIFTGAVHCRKASYPANSVEVVNYDEILKDYKKGDIIEVYYNDILTQWNVVINRNKKCIFKCIGPVNPLPVGSDFTLKIDCDNKFYYFKLN